MVRRVSSVSPVRRRGDYTDAIARSLVRENKMSRFRPRFEILTERLALATGVTTLCEAWVTNDTADLEIQIVPNSEQTGSPASDVNSPTDYFLADLNLDSNDDCLLTEDDVLFVIHQIGLHGIGPFVPLFTVPPRDFVSGIDLMISLDARDWHNCDINQDYILSPLDALLIINALNSNTD